MLVADAERLSEFLDPKRNQFDLVWSFGVVHHSPNPANAVREISKFVRKGVPPAAGCGLTQRRRSREADGVREGVLQAVLGDAQY